MCCGLIVALRKESVDRNIFACYTIDNERVALRKESVDRNAYGRINDISRLMSLSARRAWIEIRTFRLPRSATVSLSARRAWIEILYSIVWESQVLVALRKESVDRNFYLLSIRGVDNPSLSARRAWIEIIRQRPNGRWEAVALRKESVDRNYIQEGTKNGQNRSLSARRAWIEIN